MFSKLKIQKRNLYSIFFILFLMVGIMFSASAIDLRPKDQVPGYYRVNLGQFQITALLDGTMALDRALFFGISEEEKEELLSRMFITGEIPSGVNAYLINTGSKLILVDTGAGAAFGDLMGHLPKTLRAAGYKPHQIDAILITHAHPDHVGGLLDANDKLVYPKATVYISQPEADFWLSSEIMANAPDTLKPSFLFMQKAAEILSSKNKWKTFNDGDTVFPGIQGILTPGHTVGMAAFKVTSEDQTLLIWGDIVHLTALQMSNPLVGFAFDFSPGDAIFTRLNQLENVSEDKTFVAGSHLPFPGLGHVRRDDFQSYTWVPVYFSP